MLIFFAWKFNKEILLRENFTAAGQMGFLRAFGKGLAALACAVSGIAPPVLAENPGAPVHAVRGIPSGVSYSDYLKYGYAEENPYIATGRAEFNRDAPFAAGEKSTRDFIFLGASAFVMISAVKLAGGGESEQSAPTCPAG
ncbi:MAG: hypothetical protein ACR2P5_07550, partial [Gammaproteobacteria bacterium]